MVMASLSFLSDPDYAKKLILSQVEQQIGRKIEVGQAHLEIIPKIRLELSQVVIRDLDPSRVFFRAKHMDLVLRMTPLWRLQVVGKRLKVEEPQVELRRDRAGHWNFLSGAGGEVGSTQAEGNPLALVLRIRETTVTNGEVTIVDEFRQDGIRSLQVRTLDAIMSTASKGLASLSGLITAQPTFSLTFSSSPVDLGELLDRLPAEWLHPQLRTVVTERKIGGTIEVVTATVSGTTTPEPRVSATGEFRVHRGHALIGRDRIPAQNVSGTVIVEPDRIRVTDLTGRYGSMRVSGGTAAVSLTAAGPALDLEL